MNSPVDIAFDCLPLRAVGRLDVPLDASPAYQSRFEKLKTALETYGPQRVYFLYNAHCIFRFANSEIDGMVRFSFEGVVRTDASDSLADRVDLDVQLSSETCGGLPAEVQAWLEQRVRQAVAVEFGRFIAAGRLADRTREIGQLEQLSDFDDFAGMHL